MRIIRWFLGALILFFDWLTAPKGIKREDEIQAAIDQQTEKLALYEYRACPFCVKVRRAMKRQSLAIETRDAKRCNTAKEQLLAGGGTLKVPCLKIEDDHGKVSWMYESNEIIRYLDDRFAKAA